MEKFVKLFYLIGVLAIPVCAQQTAYIVEAKPYACEENGAKIQEYQSKIADSKRSGLIIVRNGDGEGSKTMTHRLRMVERYFFRGLKLDPKWFVFQTGTSAKGLGRVELYVGKELFLVMLAAKGSVPCMNCCGYDFERGIY